MIFLSRKEFEKAIEKAANEKLCNYFRWEEQTERFNCIEHRLDDLANEVSALREQTAKVQWWENDLVNRRYTTTCEAGNHNA